MKIYHLLLALAMALTSLALAITNATSGELEIGSYKHGICTFHLKLIQFCDQVENRKDKYRVRTSAYTKYILDAGHRVITKPTSDGNEVPIDDNEWDIEGLDKLLRIHWKIHTKELLFEYGDRCWWYAAMNRPCGGCNWGSWTEGDLDCNKNAHHMSRVSDMNCRFDC